MSSSSSKSLCSFQRHGSNSRRTDLYVNISREAQAWEMENCKITLPGVSLLQARVQLLGIHAVQGQIVVLVTQAHVSVHAQAAKWMVRRYRQGDCLGLQRGHASLVLLSCLVYFSVCNFLFSSLYYWLGLVYCLFLSFVRCFVCFCLFSFEFSSVFFLTCYRFWRCVVKQNSSRKDR